MEADPSVAVSVRKLVMVSLMEIFKDIAPTYRIRPLTAAEKTAKVPVILTCPGSVRVSCVVQTAVTEHVCWVGLCVAGEEGDPAAPGV